MEKHKITLVYGVIVSILTGMFIGWMALVVGLVIGLVGRFIVGWKGILYYAGGVVLGIVFLAIIAIARS